MPPLCSYYRFKTDSARTTQRKRWGIPAFLAIVYVTVCFSIPCLGEDFGIPRRKSTNYSSVFSAKKHPSTQPVYPALVPSFSEAASSPKTASQPILPEQTARRVEPAVSPPSESVFVNPLPNVVRVVAFDNKGQSLGSGSYIGNYGEYGLILSNWHVIDKTKGLVHIHFPNGFSSFGAVMHADKLWDLTLVAVSRPPQSVPRLLIAATVPQPGDSLWIAGYGAGSYRLANGRCVRYMAPEIPQDNSAPLYEIIELSASARQGDSGGPILNSAGELAGVLFGSDMVHNTAGSCNKRVNLFLEQARTKLTQLPPYPETYFASIEPAGPKRQLAETQHINSESPALDRPVHSGGVSGSSNSFGVRPSTQY